MEYIVITGVPLPGTYDTGNMATALGQIFVADTGERVGIESLGLSLEVFALGEILVCNGGREVAGKGRKPSKWSVDYETFDTIEAATERAIATTNGGN